MEFEFSIPWASETTGFSSYPHCRKPLADDAARTVTPDGLNDFATGAAAHAAGFARGDTVSPRKTRTA